MSNAALKAATTGAVTPKTREDKVGDLILAMRPQMRMALPKHIDADRMARIVLTEVRRVPKLAECGRDSLLGAVMTCSQLGLEPGNGLGHAYLLPFERRGKVQGQWTTVGIDCQLIIGYRGMIDLARRSGQIVSLSARAVFKNDTFAYRFGLDETVEHVPAEGERGDLTHVYAVAKLKDGGVQFEVLTRAEIEKVRAGSKAGSNGPWVTHYEEMAKKTAIRRLFKYLPVSIEMQRAVTLDELGEAGLAQDHNVIDMDTPVYTDPRDEAGTGSAGADPMTFAQVSDLIQKAETRDALDMARGFISAVADDGQQEELTVEADKRQQAIAERASAT